MRNVEVTIKQVTQDGMLKNLYTLTCTRFLFFKRTYYNLGDRGWYTRAGTRVDADLSHALSEQVTFHNNILKHIDPVKNAIAQLTAAGSP